MNYSSIRRHRVSISIASLLLTAFLSVWAGVASLQTKDGSDEKPPQRPVTVRAAKRGNPYVNFEDGRELDLGPGAAGTQPVAIVKGDFDSDGIADVVTADASGKLQLLKGRDPAIFAYDPKRKEQFKPEPFAAVAIDASLGISPDMMFAGDFNADGEQDIVAASKGSSGLVVVLGDGLGHFSRPVGIAVNGSITSAESGEIGLRDGQADLAVAVTNKDGSFLLVYEHPESAFKHAPETIKLPAPATALAIGNVDEDFYSDIAVACGNDLVIVHERGQAYPWDIVKDSGITRPRAVIETRQMPFSIASMAVGRFGERRGTTLAFLSGDGNIYRLEPTRKTGPTNNKIPASRFAKAASIPFSPTDVDTSKYATLSNQNLGGLAVDPAGNPLVDFNEIKAIGRDEYLEKRGAELAKNAKQYTPEVITQMTLQTRTKKAEMDARRKAAFLQSISARTSPAKEWQLETVASGSQFAVLTAGGNAELTRIKVSDSNLDDLMVTAKGSSEIQFVSRQKNTNGGRRAEVSSVSSSSATRAVLPVNVNLDGINDLMVLRDGASAPRVVLSAPMSVFYVNTTIDTLNCVPDGAGECSLRGAIIAANSNPGNDIIAFGLPAGTVISPLSELPPVTTTLSIQSGAANDGARGIEIDGSQIVGGPADGIKLRASGCFIYGLAINRMPAVSNGNGSVTGGNGITLESTSSYPNNGGNYIVGLYLGTDPTGSIARPNGATGMLIFDSDGNAVGGGGISFRNVMSGNNGPAGSLGSTGLAVTAGNSNNFQNNVIGLNAAGDAKLGNINGVFATGFDNNYGGDYPGQGNTISGNGKAYADNPNFCYGTGIFIATLYDTVTQEPLTLNTTLKGNRIGTDPAGTVPLGNCGAGVYTSPLHQTTIGSITADGRNIIGDNGFTAIRCIDEIYDISQLTSGGYCAIAGNNIGTDVTGTVSLANDDRNFLGGLYRFFGNVDLYLNLSYSYFGAPGGTTPNGACTGFCNLYAGNYRPPPNFAQFNNDIYTTGYSNVGIFNNSVGVNREGNQALANYRGISTGVLAGDFYVGGIGSDSGNPISLGNIISGQKQTAIGVSGGFANGDCSGPGTALLILGNKVGTDATGSFAIRNGYDDSFGTYISGTIGITRGFADTGSFGGDDPLARNIVSGNAGDALNIGDACFAALPVDLPVSNNLIGLNSSLLPLGNGGNGIGVAASFVQIGGTSASANQIAYNGSDNTAIHAGVVVLGRNSIPAVGVQIRGNSIHDNAGLGIDLGTHDPRPAFNVFIPDGVTVNDCQDEDLGPNGLQNFPLLLAPVQNEDNTVKVDGSLRSTRRKTFSIDFYSSLAADPSTYGEGSNLIGSISVTTNGNGFADFTFTSQNPVPADQVITATATDDRGNTSELSCAAGVCTGGRGTDPKMQAAQMELTCVQPIVVNTEGDEADPDTSDGICDVILNDSEPECTLRAAIQEANARQGYNRINFDIPGGGVHVISIQSQLPEISGDTDVDATSQPGYTSSPLIKLDGIAMGGSGIGLKVTGTNTKITGFSIVRFQYGISLIGGGSNNIQSCYLGVNSDGITAPNERMSVGVEIRDGSHDNWVGGASDGDVNVISNNDAGITISGSSINNHLLNNKIGINAASNATLPNAFGVVVDGSNNNFIGEDRTVAPNVIAGNTRFGVVLQNNSSYNTVNGNFIGVNPSDQANGDYGNLADGINIDTGASQNTIGEFETGRSNVIGNQRTTATSAGISIGPGAGLGNKILANLIGISHLAPAEPLAVVTNGIGIVVNRSGQIVGAGNSEGSNFIALNITGGIVVDGSLGPVNGIVIQRNAIGTDGTNDLGNGGSGIVLQNNVSGVQIKENVISGNNSYGISIYQADGNLVTGNLIGTDKDGTVALPNDGGGVFIFGNGNEIGAAGTNGGNTISGNTGPGVRIEAGSVGNTIRKDRIGTNLSGNDFIRNMGGGVVVRGSENVLKENTISGNASFGVAIGRGTNDPEQQKNRLVANFIGVGINGVDAIGNGYGVFISGGSSTNIIEKGNVISGNHLDGINIEDGATLNYVLGNLIGTSSDGQVSVGNSDSGIKIHGSYNFVGGVNNSEENIISGNSYGIYISKTASSSGTDATFNSISNNLIGTNLDGTSALPNTQSGLALTEGANHNIIGNALDENGGLIPNTGNLISGNSVAGVSVFTFADEGALPPYQNIIVGNSIGTNAAGDGPVGGQQWGVLIQDSPSNAVGSSSDNDDANVIAGNTVDGVAVNGALATDNVIRHNLIGVSHDQLIANGRNGINVDSAPGTVIENNNVGGNVASGVVVSNIALSRPESRTSLQKVMAPPSFLGSLKSKTASMVFKAVAAALLKPEVSPADSYSVSLAGNTIGAIKTGTNYLAAPNDIGIKFENVDSALIGDPIDRQNGNLVGAAVTDAIVLDHASNIEVISNFVGTSPAASMNIGPGQNGIHIVNQSSYIDLSLNTIGGGADSGVKIENVGNFFPTCSAGTRPTSPPFPGVSLSGNYIAVVPVPNGPPAKVPNNQGIWIENSGQITVGTVSDTTPNVVAGNTNAGITIKGSSTGVKVKGSYIGTLPPQSPIRAHDLDTKLGTINFGNGGDGVLITNGATGNTVGGPEVNAGNVIAGNGGNGVRIDDTAGGCNLVDPNSIYGNTGLGIDLGPAGHTDNDPGDSDVTASGNRLQNYPEIVTSGIDSNGDLILSYLVDSLPGNSNYGATGLYVEFFNADLQGQGQQFLGSDLYSVTDHDSLARRQRRTATRNSPALAGIKTIDLGNAAAIGFGTGDKVTATATDADGNTSEFFPPFGPSAAGVSVSGGVAFSDGRPIDKVKVTMVSAGGETRTALTNAFGYYRFDEVPVGNTYVISAEGKGLQFSQPSRLITVDDVMTDVDFKALSP